MVRWTKLWIQLFRGKTMGKVKGLMMQMEEDALWMAKEAWVYLYGESYEKLYDEVHRNVDQEDIMRGYDNVNQ